MCVAFRMKMGIVMPPSCGTAEAGPCRAFVEIFLVHGDVGQIDVGRRQYFLDLDARELFQRRAYGWVWTKPRTSR